MSRISSVFNPIERGRWHGWPITRVMYSLAWGLPIPQLDYLPGANQPNQPHLSGFGTGNGTRLKDTQRGRVPFPIRLATVRNSTSTWSKQNRVIFVHLSPLKRWGNLEVAFVKAKKHQKETSNYLWKRSIESSVTWGQFMLIVSTGSKVGYRKHQFSDCFLLPGVVFIVMEAQVCCTGSVWRSLALLCAFYLSMSQ